MRLIDADTLSTAYENTMKELLQATNVKSISLEELSLLCGAKLIAEAPTVGGWINVNDSLPKDSRDVLIYVKNYEDYPVTTGCYIRSIGKWWKYGNPCKQDTVTHWMPFPEPPEEEN